MDSEHLKICASLGYNMPRLYSEIMRACLITLNDVQGTSIESQWGAFTFLKVPHILRQLHFTIRGGENGESQEKMEFSQDVVDALELLLQYTPLLDIMDAKCSCNCIECLLKELLKNGLVTESHVTHFTSKRETMTTTIQKLDQSNTQAPSIPKVIVRAEPTLSRILKTLDADYAKVQILHQDALLKPMNMVQQFLTPLSNEEMSQQDNFKERSALMFQIIRKMQYDVHPPTQSKVIVMTLSHRSEELVEPQASALAKLCAYCVFAALEFQSNTTPGQVNSRKRSRRDMEGEDLEGLYPSSKLLRMSSGVAETADTAALFGTATSSSQNSTQPYSNSSQPTTIKEPLQKALNDLFHTFTVIAGRDGEVSQQTHFVCKFLQFVVRCGRDRTRLVLQGMPNTLVPCLLRSLPDLFTTDLLLRLYDINTVAGRKATARDLCMLRNMDLKMSMTDTV
ncbi:hypothetical protein ANN_07130 [Periplaneta americana]|uniref:Mediator of RNA polymerase II transcription subunit 24 n=1 Tax=Periplaneta americana TaxID=6978 RepID=A0ABQ8THK4_PERAM|nr:hypothetical protein ANN_07130 [Periplaneta americana]